MLRLIRSVTGLRPIVRASALVAGLVALAACSSSLQESGPAPVAQASGPQPVTGEVLGSGSVRVALLVPQSATGNAGQIGLALKNAADLALREFSGANIQIMVKDDRGTPDGARAATSEAIAQGAEVILGPLFAQSVTAAASIAKPAGVPVIAFSTDTSAASRGVYLLSFLPQTDVDRIIGYAATQGRRSYVALLPANGYGTVVEAALQKAVSVNGGRVVGIQRYQLDRTDMQGKAEAAAEVILAGQADAVFMPDAGDAAPFLAQVLAAKGVRGDAVKFLGSGQWDDPRIAAEPSLRGAWYPAPDKAGFQGFAARYQAAFGQPPQRAASLAYDAVSLAAGLAARFGEQRFAPDTIANPSGFLGIDGAFRFLPDGTNQRGLAVYELGTGAPTLLDPAPRSFSRAGF
ncbi:penicillin-binding protein activator [Prosthecomicrobium pneumaticum]|uniref:ABC-type branched-subunit amino acid transport system substrate-binding protein n=1 Tax=Prosthecomicrobium pneumaticum TaxID=81895 RepID=A0A7W9FNG9_9HYPH|nr:ABC-type branched-subunit amino acid transport system substrate-binding protein [Prosthecomicrobium pneumaticum]